jgi:hypothetical protein
LKTTAKFFISFFIRVQFIVDTLWLSLTDQSVKDNSRLESLVSFTKKSLLRAQKDNFTWYITLYIHKF